MPDKDSASAIERGRRRWRLTAVLALAVLLIAGGALGARARSAAARASAALSRGEPAVAAVEFERALGFSVPFDPVFDRSVDGMRAAAAAQERAGDLAAAWRTLERLQAAIRETASILRRDAPVLGELEAEQRRLEARIGAPAALASRPSGPGALPARPFTSALALLALGSWVACTFVLAARRERGTPARAWLAASVAAWLAWVAALWLA